MGVSLLPLSLSVSLTHSLAISRGVREREREGAGPHSLSISNAISLPPSLQGIAEGVGLAEKPSRHKVLGVREDPRLAEQQFGNFQVCVCVCVCMCVCVCVCVYVCVLHPLLCSCRALILLLLLLLRPAFPFRTWRRCTRRAGSGRGSVGSSTASLRASRAWTSTSARLGPCKHITSMGVYLGRIQQQGARALNVSTD